MQVGTKKASSIQKDTKADDPRGKYARTGYVSPIDATLEVIGGKYKVAILFHLKDGLRRFGELRRLVRTATQRMLTNQLRELESDGLITRTVFPTVPPRVDYELTALGHSLLAPVSALADWALKNRGKIVEAQAAFDGQCERSGKRPLRPRTPARLGSRAAA